ncbi:hypothetical protein ACLOJK_011666 [Asimina triloba]
MESSRESDIQCLEAVKESLIDPKGYLLSWNFGGATQSSVCGFMGIACDHVDKRRVTEIHLSNMGLQGQFPAGLERCKSLNVLDLSSNQLSGPIPPNISKKLPRLTALNLSFNSFSGKIPPDIANCRSLSALNLDHNSLSGQIPSFTFPLAPSQFSNNMGLCEAPLEKCREPPRPSRIVWLVVVGVFLILAISATWFLCFLGKSRKIQEDDIEGSRGTEHTNGASGNKANFSYNVRKYCKVHISTFERTVPRMRLHALLKATSNFSKDAVIGCGKAGSMYKARIPDGSSLAIKRLHDSELSNKEFMSEMMILGCLRHRNLIPLLGFCIARNERLLIYEHMPRGSLYQQLHEVRSGQECMRWPLRLKVAIGVARGLAWLHHSCNPSVVHRRMSSKHILLDGDYEPKISKFRSAGLMNPTDSYQTVPVNNTPSDLLGFVAPEFTRKVVASVPGDVYSFGVVLLELISRQKPTQVSNAPKEFKGNLVEWVTYLKSISLVGNAIDRSLIGKGYDDELFQFIRVAIACIEFEPEKRPTMAVVFRLLQSLGKRHGFADEDETQQPQVCTDINSYDGFNAQRNTGIVKAVSASF